MDKVMDHLPPNMKGWRKLVDEAVDHLRMAMGGKHSVVIVGPANTGKSTFYNQLIRSRTEKARVSVLPGTTRFAQVGDAGLFSVVDTPGADAIGSVGEQERERALEAAQRGDVLLVLFDATHGIRGPEKQLFDLLTSLEKPLVIALNKIDLVWSERVAAQEKAASVLGLSTEEVIPLSAKTGFGAIRVLQSIVKTEPRIVAALGQALPQYRKQLSEVVIRQAAATAAAVAVTPLPFIDFIPLIAIQSTMVLSIARIHSYRINLARARELVVTFGLGVVARMLFHELSKLGGPPGWLVAAAVAAGTTTGMGYACISWFERGERLSSEALKGISLTVSQSLLGRLRIGRRHPKRKEIRQEVGKALEAMDEQQGLPGPDQLYP